MALCTLKIPAVYPLPDEQAPLEWDSSTAPPTGNNWLTLGPEGWIEESGTYTWWRGTPRSWTTGNVFTLWDLKAEPGSLVISGVLPQNHSASPQPHCTPWPGPVLSALWINNPPFVYVVGVVFGITHFTEEETVARKVRRMALVTGLVSNRAGIPAMAVWLPSSAQSSAESLGAATAGPDTHLTLIVMMASSSWPWRTLASCWPHGLGVPAGRTGSAYGTGGNCELPGATP